MNRDLEYWQRRAFDAESASGSEARRRAEILKEFGVASDTAFSLTCWHDESDLRYLVGVIKDLQSKLNHYDIKTIQEQIKTAREEGRMRGLVEAKRNAEFEKYLDS